MANRIEKIRNKIKSLRDWLKTTVSKEEKFEILKQITSLTKELIFFEDMELSKN